MEVESRQTGKTGKGGVLRPPKAPESATALTVIWWPIGRPKPYPKNARKWSRSAVEKVAASIKAFGWVQPIVCDREDVIVIGHLRLAAAHFLGLTEVPVHVRRTYRRRRLKHCASPITGPTRSQTGLKTC